MITGILRGSAGVRERVAYLRQSLTVSAVLAILGAIVGGVVAGAAGALGVAAGVALVAASYTATTLAIAWADTVNPRMVLPVGMAMYITKFSLLGALLIFVGATTWAGKIPMAMGIVAGVIVSTAAQIWWTRRHEHPYVDRPTP